ncbi:hypothetical protein [Nocardia brasiliensis]|uniref:Knr4/Smi1-like domain-containing protein n=1 Tax=Nocardia brasiliensis (strain ATCC 700358 / HUJEG-1) TaxID=1133849 RepID=K0ELR9_NOCB7|nr:hypothetical protein [Nocardia brasiliensis]AFU00493.1 hypothetical protein O3I_012660 [Nocardia brasiliensis ATCC 700358]OCF84399.1 hypothetical protein AW168_01260 [Nocardia brasiliensis]
MSVCTADLVGYTERDLDADLARWFPAAPRVQVPEETRSVTAFLARLAPSDAAALSAFDRRVRSGLLPQFLDIFDWSYGFDFAGNDCGILDSDYTTELTDDDVYSIGADGGGNLYVVLTNGQVAVWFHEEEVVEGGTRFDNLDVFLWSFVRYRAVRAGQLARSAVEADFLALGQDGALEPELGLLQLMK